MKNGFAFVVVTALVGGALLLLPRAWGAAAEGELPPGTTLFLVDPNYFSESNIPLRDLPGRPAVLTLVTPIQPRVPYHATFPVPVPAAGRWSVWAFSLPRDSGWTSPYSARIDQGVPCRSPRLAARDGTAKWEHLGVWELPRGLANLTVQVDGGRQSADGGYYFTLWKLLLVKDPAFVPDPLKLDLEFNPQLFRDQTAIEGKRYSEIPTLSRPNRRVVLRGSLDQTQGMPAPVWRDYAQGGEFDRAEFLQPRYARALRPRFVRKDHCLDNSLKRGPGGAVSYDFARGLRQLRAIFALGAEPVAGLDMFPPDLLQGKDKQTLWRDAAFMREWSRLVTAFTTCVLKENKLPVRYFQYFNEPDNTGYINAGDTLVATYIAAAQAVKQVAPAAKVGGIGTGDGMSCPLNAYFIGRLAGRPELVDFFDFHIYQSRPDRIGSSVAVARELLDRNGLQDTKIAVTEWGMSSGTTTALAAADTVPYNASQIKAMVEAGVAMGGLFCLVDPNGAGAPGAVPDQWGLITADGFLKPAFWGQWLWSQLPEDGRRVTMTGEQDGIETFAVTKGDAVWVLVWNGRAHGEPDKVVTLEIAGVRQAEMSLRQYVVNEFYSMPFLPAGAPVELPAVRAERCGPKDRQLAIDLQLASGTLTLVIVQD